MLWRDKPTPTVPPSPVPKEPIGKEVAIRQATKTKEPAKNLVVSPLKPAATVSPKPAQSSSVAAKEAYQALVMRVRAVVRKDPKRVAELIKKWIAADG